MRALFAPWRWRRSEVVAATVLTLFAAYFASPSLVLWLIWKMGLERGPVEDVYNFVYRPIEILCDFFPWLDRMYGLQLETLFALSPELSD